MYCWAAGIFYLFKSGWQQQPKLRSWGEILNFMALKHCYGKWDESCVTFWRPPGAPFEASSVGMVIARHPIIRDQVFWSHRRGTTDLPPLRRWLRRQQPASAYVAAAASLDWPKITQSLKSKTLSKVNPFFRT